MDGIVMWGDSPVLRMVILVWIVLLMVSEESIELNTLSEVFDYLDTSNVFKEIEISIMINRSSDKSVPVDTLELYVGIVLLEFEAHEVTKVDVWSLNCMHILSCHFKLVEIEVLGEHLHIGNK